MSNKRNTKNIDIYMGVPLNEHERYCDCWYEWSCNCKFSRSLTIEEQTEMLKSGKLVEPAGEFVPVWELFSDWEETHPPRRSKSARPVEGESGRSLFDIQRLIGRRGKRDK